MPNLYLFAYGLGCSKSCINQGAIIVWPKTYTMSLEKISYSDNCDSGSSQPHGMCCGDANAEVSYAPTYISSTHASFRKLTADTTEQTGPLVVFSTSQTRLDEQTKLLDLEENSKGFDRSHRSTLRNITWPSLGILPALIVIFLQYIFLYQYGLTNPVSVILGCAGPREFTRCEVLFSAHISWSRKITGV